MWRCLTELKGSKVVGLLESGSIQALKNQEGLAPLSQLYFQRMSASFFSLSWAQRGERWS